MFRMGMQRYLGYRSAALAGIATQFFWGFLLMSMLQAFARGGNSPLDDGAIASYIWVQQAFLILLVVWFRDTDLVRGIVRGDTDVDLCRPVDLYLLWFSRLWGGRMGAAVLRSIPILVAASLLPPPWRLEWPPLPVLAAFVPVLLLGSCMAVAISLFAYVLTLRSLHTQSAFILLTPLAEFLGGQTLPLDFLPPPMAGAFRLLPFRCLTDLPLGLWNRSISLGDLPAALGLELFWLLVLVAGGRAFLARTVAVREGAGS